MKKGVIFVLIFAIIIAGVLLHKMDEKTIRSGNEPKYTIKIVSEDKKEVKYLGLGYVLYRKYKNSPNERMGDSLNLKFGVWFLEKQEIIIEND